MADYFVWLEFEARKGLDGGKNLLGEGPGDEVCLADHPKQNV